MTPAALAAVSPTSVGQLLEQIAERDYWLRRIRNAALAGYDRGREDGYRQGREDEGAERDRAWQLQADPIARSKVPPLVEQERRRWKLRGEERSRESFGRPHQADRPVRRQASGPVYLGGPPVHHHRCAGPCYRIRPGAYSPGDAAAILSTLPGDYAAVIASLRARAARGGDG